jgi:ArsR family transcriptional regulator, arsenate/arsenite/antimonite-responsive transcriptional repressor
MGAMPKALPVLVDVSPISLESLGARSSLTEEDAVALAIRLKALADPTRLRLLVFILDQDGQEACTCELAPFVALSEPTVSHHLKTLERAGLVAKERRGMSVHYRVVPEAIDAIARALHLSGC